MNSVTSILKHKPSKFDKIRLKENANPALNLILPSKSKAALTSRELPSLFETSRQTQEKPLSTLFSYDLK